MSCSENRAGWQGGKWIRPEKRIAIYIRDNFSCNYCGKNLKNETGAGVTLDHIIPRSKYETVKGNKIGMNDGGNLITACKTCNSSRQDKNVEDYATGGALLRIAEQIKLPLNIKLAKDLIKGRANEKIENLR